MIEPEIPKPEPEDTMASLQESYEPLSEAPSLTKVMESLLKAPGRLMYEISEGRASSVARNLLLIVVLFSLGYGAIIGSFSGGAQLWAAPFKVLAGLVLSGLICLPSLYILSSIAGSKLSLPHTAALLVQALALATMLLVGFAPIAWIFSQATETTWFMGFLHLAIWVASAWFGLRFLRRAMSFHHKGHLALIKVWSVLFLVVTFQMTTTLRPLIGPASGFEFQEKKCFLEHWGLVSFPHTEPKPRRLN